jgi:hypothetical protein
VTSLFHKNSPHGFGRSREEVPAAIPTLLIRCADQSKVGFVHQGRGLQSLPGVFLSEARCGEFPQFLVNERQELVRCLRVTLLDG